MIERRGWLANQARFTETVPTPGAGSAPNRAATTPNRDLSGVAPVLQLSRCGCAEAAATALPAGCRCGQAALVADGAALGAAWVDDRSSIAHSDSHGASRKPSVSLATFVNELFHSGTQLLAMFVGFAFIGYVTRTR